MKLIQNIGWNKQATFTLFEDKVRVEYRAPFRSGEYAVNYSNIDENPIRNKQIHAFFRFVGWLLLVIGVICGSVIASRDEHDAIMVGLIILGIFLVFALGVLAYARFHTFDLLIYRTAMGNLIFHMNQPSRDEFIEFQAELQKKIFESRSLEARIIRGVLNVLKQRSMIDAYQYETLCGEFGVPTPTTDQSG